MSGKKEDKQRLRMYEQLLEDSPQEEENTAEEVYTFSMLTSIEVVDLSLLSTWISAQGASFSMESRTGTPAKEREHPKCKKLFPEMIRKLSRRLTWDKNTRGKSRCVVRTLSANPGTGIQPDRAVSAANTPKFIIVIDVVISAPC